MKKKHILTIVCVFALLAAFATGCGGSSYSGKGAAENYTAAAPEVAYSDSGYYAADETDGIQYSGGGESLGSTDAVPADPSAKLIYTIELSVETLDYEKSLETIDSLTAQYGGYVEYAQSENNRINSTRLRSAYYTLRIPAAQLSAFLDSCGAVGNVVSSTRSTENRTAEYADLNARLNTLRIEEQSLQELLEKAEDLDTIVSLHSYLSDVRYSIERVEANMRGIDSLVSYSTVHLSLSEVKFAVDPVTPASTFGERLKARSSEAWRDFSDSLENFGVFLFGELPSILVSIILYLLPVAIIVFVIVLLVRRGKKKRAARRAAQQQYMQQAYFPQQPGAPAQSEAPAPSETPKE